MQTSDGSQEQVGPEGKEEQRASESDEGPVDGQAEITTPVPAKEPKLAPVSDGSPEGDDIAAKGLSSCSHPLANGPHGDVLCICGCQPLCVSDILSPSHHSIAWSPDHAYDAGLGKSLVWRLLN